MVTNMVAATVSGMAADIERKWLAQMLQEPVAKTARNHRDKTTGIRGEIAGIYGLTQKAEQEWLSMLGSRI